ncbi:patatin-like phospholipase family protein [Patescibacteria group bacterium]|nr:patatin-like phospholipase family protein [Patescibacteria group bacterium]MBU2259778.1 patatin-like phospholipase family protein [Patescibacteria group bacterium]
MTFGLVLSGGSALGMANAGVLERLEEEHLKPDFIAGSSMGAIVSAIYALGHPPSVFHELLGQLKFSKLAMLSEKPLQHGLHGGLLRQRIKEHLEPLIGEATIADCIIPFICIAGRVKEPIRWERIVQKGFSDHVTSIVEKHVFPPETKILDAIMASSSLPVIFSPYEINGDTFVDLCNFGAIPARTMREIFHPDIVIATDTTPSYPLLRKYGPPGVRRFIEEAANSRDESRAACDLIIEPKLPSGMIRFDKGEEFMEAGCEAVEENLPKLKELIA